MFILKGFKVVCFVIVLQVFILKGLIGGVENTEVDGRKLKVERFWGSERLLSREYTQGCGEEEGRTGDTVDRTLTKEYLIPGYLSSDKLKAVD